MLKFITAIPMATAAALAFSGPTAAQDGAGDKVNVVIVYGDDECPQSTADEITVCARKAENERYRIPEELRDDPFAPENQAWTERVRSFEYVGASGTESCSPAGAGGFTGCTQQLVRQAYAEREQGSSVQAGRLIEEARQERLSRIDEEAEAVQSRVEEVERELAEREEERLQAAQDAEAGDDEGGDE